MTSVISDYFTMLYGNANTGELFNLIGTLVTYAICIVIVFNDFKRDRKGILLRFVDFAITFIYMHVVGFFVYLINANMAIFFYIVIPLTILPHAFLTNKYKLPRRLMTAMTLNSFLVLCFRMSLDIGFLLNISWQDYFFVFIICAVGVFFLRLFPLDNYSKVIWPCFLSQFIVFVSTYIAVTTMTGSIHIIDFTPASLTICIVLYIIACVTYYLAHMLLAYYEKDLTDRALLFKSQSDYQSLKVAQENMEELKKIRHDLKSQYQYMKYLLDQKNYEGLEKHFNDMYETAFVPLSFIDCGNNVVSSVMNLEIGKAREYNIAIKPTLLVPSQVGINDYDFSRYLINIIDNAIEATALDKITTIPITVSITYQEPYLKIAVKNPTSKHEVLAEGLTSKEDKAIHGYGKRIIKEITNKYDGAIEEKIEKNTYCVYAMLKVPEVKEKEKNV